VYLCEITDAAQSHDHFISEKLCSDTGSCERRADLCAANCCLIEKKQGLFRGPCVLFRHNRFVKTNKWHEGSVLSSGPYSSFTSSFGTFVLS